MRHAAPDKSLVFIPVPKPADLPHRPGFSDHHSIRRPACVHGISTGFAAPAPGRTTRAPHRRTGPIPFRFRPRVTISARGSQPAVAGRNRAMTGLAAPRARYRDLYPPGRGLPDDVKKRFEEMRPPAQNNLAATATQGK